MIRTVLASAAVVSLLLVCASHPLAGQPAAAARPPAPTLARVTSTPKAPHADGFIQRWLLLEPLKVPPQLTETAVRAAVSKAAIADRLAVPRAGETVAAEGGPLAWHAVDTRGYNVNLFHFAYALGKPTSNVLFQAVTVIDVPAETPGVRLAIGSNAASIWWLNGEEVIALFNDRQSVVDDGVSTRVTLRKGANVIRAAVINAGGATDFCARIIDEDGRPVKRFTVRLDAGTPPQGGAGR
jgi:hypothetical protein